MPVILATQEAELSGGSRFEASLGKQFARPYLEKNPHKNRAGGVAQGVGPEFKPEYCQKKKKKKVLIRKDWVRVPQTKSFQQGSGLGRGEQPTVGQKRNPGRILLSCLSYGMKASNSWRQSKKQHKQLSPCSTGHR
jgi:hypothetical protein